MNKQARIHMAINHTVRNVCRVIMLAIVLILPACEVIQLQPKDVEAEVVLAKYKDIPLNKALTDVQDLFQKAKAESLYFFSPGNYRIAKNGINTARGYAKNPDRLTLVLKSIHKAETAIQDGLVVKEIVEREMAELIKVRTALEALDAKRIAQREYRSLVTAMTNLITKVEKHKNALFENAESKADFDSDNKALLEEYKKFQLRVVKQKYLNRGENLMAEAENFDAKNNAPQTYSEATKAREEAISFVENNLDNEIGVKQASDKFEFAAQRLLHITRAVEELKTLEKDKHEDYVLRNENRFDKIAKAIKSTDLRDKSFDAQSTALASVIRTVVRQKERNALKIAELRSEEEKESGEENDSIPEIQKQPSADTDDGPQRVIPGPDGDIALKRQIGELTMQVESMRLERNEMEKSVLNLQAKVKELQAKLAQSKPAAKTKKKTAPKKASTTPAKSDATKSDKAKTDTAKSEAKSTTDKKKSDTPAAKPKENTEQTDKAQAKQEAKPADSAPKKADTPEKEATSADEKAKQADDKPAESGADASNENATKQSSSDSKTATDAAGTTEVKK